ncbi:MAG: DUF748 domain-containing protein [Candidatus Synoicihabitans palmerolidicus]|nr:DUF748 domain-containing protein [Candidatus Synoicihabitans palmerolidicus]
MLFVTVVGWVVVSVLREQLRDRLSEQTGREVTVGAVAVNPFKLAVTVEALRVTEPEGLVLVGCDRLMVNLRIGALVRGTWEFDAIELDGLEGRIAVDPEGEINFADVMPKEGDGTEGTTPWVLAIGRLVVRDARVEFSDASRVTPFATTLGPVSLRLEDFHTDGDSRAPYEF